MYPMGFWSFLSGSGTKAEETDDSGAPTPEALAKEAQKIGVTVSPEDIAIKDGKVTLSGGAMDDELKEKVILAVGNVEGVSGVEAETANEPVFVTVKSGDSLWKIAQAELGDGNRYNEIFEANKPMLSDPDKIYPGQMLRIPVS